LLLWCWSGGVAGLVRAAIGGFHDAGTTTGHDGEAKPRDRRSHLTGEHDFVGATGGRRRAWRHWLRFGGSRSCGHLFALGAVRLRVAEAGVISNALRLAEGSRCGLRVL
jgi:hypothetical protein